MMYLGQNAVGLAVRAEFNPLQYLNYTNAYINLFKGAVLPTNVILDFNGTNKTLFQSILDSTTGIETVTIKNLVSNSDSISFHYAFAYSSIKKIIFQDCNFSPKLFSYTFRSMNSLEEIIGELDFTNTTSVEAIFHSSNGIKEMRFKQNTLKISMTIGSYFLTDDSLISIANGLNETVTGQTLSLSTTCYTKCGKILGRNENGLFITDENGILTLSDFITNIKGWTLQ